MKAIILLVGLAGCAAPACKPVAITEQLPPQVVERIIVIHDTPVHFALLADYAQTLRAEKPIVLQSKAPVIDQLIKLDAAARVAFEPIERRNHRATQAEIATAVAALGAVQAYVSQKH